MAERSVSTQDVAVPRAGTYRIDPERSTVRFTTRGMFGLAKAVGTVAIREGVVVVTDPIEKSGVRAVLDANSVNTANRKRDDHLRTKDFLDVATHPDITFVADGIREASGAWVVPGTLTVHGVSRPVELTITAAAPAASEVRFHAVTRIDRNEFGVSKMKGMVARHQAIDLDLIAVPSAG
ncbi:MULTISPECIES: YceI family protein [unclassified Frankia]|uniref:YceI family protein n=1 Tax=unclassified Frankia TaxID=2632575 RepID=UPI002AD2C1D5|nr:MULTISPECIES: YceI family protein [unclassified Frankia]